MYQEGCHSLILDTMLEAATMLRYTVGDDAAAMIQAKISMSDTEFAKLMKKQFLSK